MGLRNPLQHPADLHSVEGLLYTGRVPFSIQATGYLSESQSGFSEQVHIANGLPLTVGCRSLFAEVSTRGRRISSSQEKAFGIDGVED